jgi:hypothetical protein
MKVGKILVCATQDIIKTLMAKNILHLEVIEGVGQITNHIMKE